MEKDPLTGIPFRLSKKFYPLVRPPVRDIDIHIPLDALQDEYDFTFERQMISKYEVLEEEKERLKIKAEEKLAQERKKLEEAEALRVGQEAAEAEALRVRAAQDAEADRKKLEVVRTVNEDDKKEDKPIFILRRDNEQKQIPVPTNLKSYQNNPTTQSVLMVERGNNKVDGCYKPSQQTTTLPSSFARVSLSEFETDTENPFDSIELKSMNDKAELANIWSKVLQQEQQQKQNHIQLSSKLPVSTTPNNSPTATNQSQASSNNILVNGQVAPSPPPASVAAVTSSSSSSASSNSFTKLHFPFLSNYAQTNTTAKNREYERAMERSYYQHYHQQQNVSSHPALSFPNNQQQDISHSQQNLHYQQQLSSANGPPPLIGQPFIGAAFNSAGILSTMVPHYHQPSSIASSTNSPSMSNIPNLLYPNSTNKYNNTTNLQ